MTSVSEKKIKPKLGVLELTKELSNVFKACKVMGYFRDSFYRFKTLYENDVMGQSIPPQAKAVFIEDNDHNFSYSDFLYATMLDINTTIMRDILC